MNLRLVSLMGVKFDREVYEVMVPTPDGIIAIFPDHEALISLLVPGVLSVRYDKTDPDEKLEHFAVSGGVVEIGANKVKVLADEADHGDEIVESEAKAALERALKDKSEAKDQVELDRAHELIDRHAVRLKVAELRRHHRRI
ncbi:ATP synthase F1 subunit epsilon [Candidatus Saccharibacteria bacterium]|nr:ATP synthase F1 subunit epsilon [Candidatus Saccharibacteria bacterium]